MKYTRGYYIIITSMVVVVESIILHMRLISFPFSIPLYGEKKKLFLISCSFLSYNSQSGYHILFTCCFLFFTSTNLQ
jgi:hypothetical protein